MSAPASNLSIAEQAELIECLAARCYPYAGKNAGPVLLSIEQCVADELMALAARLRRIAPHELAIRKMVAGR